MKIKIIKAIQIIEILFLVFLIIEEKVIEKNTQTLCNSVKLDTPITEQDLIKKGFNKHSSVSYVYFTYSIRGEYSCAVRMEDNKITKNHFDSE